MQTPDVLRSLGYVVVDFLGKGSYGEVKLANSKRHQKQVAIKIMHRRLSPDDFVHKLLPRELLILKTAKHPHIAQVHEIFEMPDGQVFVVMEAAKMNLQEKLWDINCVPIGKAKTWFSQLLSAVEYLHQQDIVHRDLKCRNVLLTADNQIKLVDFGLAKFSEGLCDTFYCTPENAAPEVLAKMPYDAKKSDVWSLGVIFYAMVTGTMPFRAISWKGLIKAQKKPLTFPKGISVDKNCKNFIKYILQHDPSTRPSVTEVANHPWLKSVQECEAIETSDSSPVEGEESKIKDEHSEEDGGEDDTVSRLLSEAQAIIHRLEDNSRVEKAIDDDQDGGPCSSNSSSSDFCALQQKEDVFPCSSSSPSSSYDMESLFSEPEEDTSQARASHNMKIVEEVTCSPLCAAVKRVAKAYVAAPIRKASQCLRKKMRKFLTVKSTVANSSFESQQEALLGNATPVDSERSNLPMETTVQQKTKRLRFPKITMPKIKKRVQPL